jgi:nitroimidazol reductase NimA-like FMN-containing flavoprotein (pyridoxamine 5'-phosphate oxidase superfamily)
MFGKLTQSEIEEVIKQQVIGRLGCHAQDITYVVPVSYAYDGEYIYGHTLEGMKIFMMRRNPKVCFQTDNLNTKDTANWQSVIAWGDFEELNGLDDRKLALQKLSARRLPLSSSQTTRLTAQWPFSAEDVTSIKGIVYRIRLKEKTGRFERTDGINF